MRPSAREVQRPVKLVLTRRQLFFSVGFRPAYECRIGLGSDRRGRLTAMDHQFKAETSSYETFREPATASGQMLYSMNNARVTYQSVALDVNTPMPISYLAWVSSASVGAGNTSQGCSDGSCAHGCSVCGGVVSGLVYVADKSRRGWAG
ncbi:molybdopterin cofactor-binding domain-containing protein [Streptomyces sp. NBC_01361]|uniref:molybdopterin cofactor-binding domain-containing protein n=1 Tax=Streptomyces sp. NBC_01361 TaxID=2903838 RepID=UPI002E348902|nr:molybdopterin cofactor-binding domain-containing protein [Streptomyces sp. NBC_01361]